MGDNGTTNSNCGANFKEVLQRITGVESSVRKSQNRFEDVARQFNNAKQTEDQRLNAEALKSAKKDEAFSNLATKSDTDKIIKEIQNSALRRDSSEAPKGDTQSKGTPVAKKNSSEAPKGDTQSKGTPVAKKTEFNVKKATESVPKTKGDSKLEKIDKTLTKVATSQEKEQKSSQHTKTQQRLEELFGDQKKHNNESANKLDELFGKANTKLEGVDNSINEIKEPLLKKLSMNFAEKIIEFATSTPGMMIIAFVAGYIKGWLEQQPWFQMVKKIMSSPIVKAILGGAAIALLLNHLTGGLLGAIAKPLLGLLGKGVGALLTKGLPMLLKGGLMAAKGLMSFMTSPVGMGVAAFAAGAAIGYAGYKLISNKLHEMREEETKKINESAEQFKSAAKTKEENKTQLEKLKGTDENGDQFMQVRNDKGFFETVKGHFDADGNFVVTEKMGEGGKMVAVEPDTMGISVADVKKKTRKMSFNWIAQSKKGITRVQFGQIEPDVKRGFMKYVDENYCQTGELPAGTSTKLMSALLCFSAHYSVEGEGLSADDGEAGLKRQLAETWETLNDVLKRYEPGHERLRQFVENYKIVYGKLVGYMVPKSNRGAIMSAVQQEKFLFEKNYFQSDDWNHIAFAATIYQIWLDIFLHYVNNEFGTEFKSNTITKAEYDAAMGNEKGVQSQALALSTSLATQARVDNADKKRREQIKIEAAKKKAAKKEKVALHQEEGPDGMKIWKRPDGSNASAEEIDAFLAEQDQVSEKPKSKEEVLSEKIDQLSAQVAEASQNSKKAADNSKKAEQAGTAAAVTSAQGNARMRREAGARANGEKQKRSR